MTLMKSATIAALLGATATIAFAQGGPGGFAAFDTNHDNVISRAEFDAGNAARFTQLDANNDGSLSASERPQMPAGVAPPPPPPGAPPRPSWDANNDGAVSRAEFDAAGVRMFARIDANSNGQIDQDEQRPPPPR